MNIYTDKKQNIMKAIDRLILFHEYLKKNEDFGGRNVFEKRIGKSDGYLTNAKKNGSEISSDLVASIAKEFPNLNPTWLVTGEGSMLKSEKHSQDKTFIDDIESEMRKYGITLKPHFDSKIACGHDGFEAMLKLEDSNLKGLPITSDYDFSIVAGGNSMINRKHPHLSISPGDILAFKIVTGRFIEWGEVYALATTDGIIAKKLLKGESDEYITCVSFNEEDGYDPFNLYKSEVFGIAKLVGMIRINIIAMH